MSGRASPGRRAAEQVRQRLAWLSAQEAAVRNVGDTRPFTAAEHAELATRHAERAVLLRTLNRLAEAWRPALPRATPERHAAA